MTETLINAKLRSGESIAFEVDEVDSLGVEAVAIAIDDETGLVDFDRALRGVKEAATQVLDTLRSIATPPDSCQITFGIKLSGSLGAIIARASTEANFTITMTWAAGDKA